MTSYFVRSLLSECRIDYEVTPAAKAAASPRGASSRTGLTNLVFTMTKTKVHAENETHILCCV
jgi:hypothetical protein